MNLDIAKIFLDHGDAMQSWPKAALWHLKRHVAFGGEIHIKKVNSTNDIMILITRGSYYEVMISRELCIVTHGNVTNTNTWPCPATK